MKERDYDTLCKFCDVLILEEKSFYRVAISWLHVIREHPIFLRQYNNIFRQKNLFLHFTTELLTGFKHFLLFLFNLRNSFNKKNYNFKKKVDILFISHLLNESQLKEKEDFYFGDLANRFEKEGFHTMTALINNTKKNNYTNINYSNKFILLHTQFFFKELNYLISLIYQGLKLFKLRKKKSDKKFKKIAISAAFNSISPSTFASLRISDQVDSLVNLLSPKVLVFTFEGHAWERAVIYRSKNSNKKIICIGYQHAALFKKQHAIKRLISKKFDPDVILTAGRLFYTKFINEYKLKDIPIENLGSKRIFNYKKISDKKIPQNKTCLVIPEGYESEAVKLFDFALRYSGLNKNFKFIFRLHPALNFNNIKKIKPELNQSKNNIILSNKSLEYDLERSSFVLYRGSTAVIQAVLANLSPIYLSENNEMSIDLLSPVLKNENHVKNINDFNEVISNHNISRQNHVKIKNYCKLFYQEFDFKILKKYVL